jgi:hypothetical protein
MKESDEGGWGLKVRTKRAVKRSAMSQIVSHDHHVLFDLPP